METSTPASTPTPGASPGATPRPTTTQAPAPGQKSGTAPPVPGTTTRANGLDALAKAGFDVDPETGRMRVKLGDEVEDWDAEEFARWAGKARKERAGEKNFVEGKRLREEAAQREAQFALIEEALKDPARLPDILAQFGHKKVDLAQRWLTAEITAAGMTEEQRKIAELEAQNQKLKQEQETRAQTESEARKAAAKEQYRQHYHATFAQALQEAGLPIDGSDQRALWAIQRMAHLHRANKAGLPVLDLAQEVSADIDGGASVRLATLMKGDPMNGDGNAALEWLEARHPGSVKFLQLAILHRHRQGKLQPAGNTPAAQPPRAPAPRNERGQFTDGRPRDRYEARQHVKDIIAGLGR